MSEKLIASFQMTDHVNGGIVGFDLWQPVKTSHADDFEKTWRPIFDEHIAAITASGGNIHDAVALKQIQDAHWEWAQKANAIQGRMDWTSFALEGNGVAQGLMFVKTAGFARESSQAGLPLVEIVLLATAPWNRRTLFDVPQFKGIGRLMLAAAISLSVHEEFAGRVGLHALPQAESWYRDICGMTDLGVDSTGMRYFELTEAQARAFVK